MRRHAKRGTAGVLAAMVLPVAVMGQVTEPESVQSVDEFELADILDRAGERALTFATELQNLVWTNIVRHETLDEDGRPVEEDKPRELTFEMVVQLESNGYPTGHAFIFRETVELKLVDGEPVAPDYELPWNGPQHASPGFVGFLLHPVREQYSFLYAGRGDLRGDDAIMVDFAAPRSENAPRVLRFSDDIVSVTGIANTGRLWIDPETYDVLQIDAQLGPVEFVQRRNERDRWRFERRWSERYKTIAFEDPEQVFLVPESAETVTLLEGEPPAVRRTVHSFTDYRRFIGDVRITPLED